jgi:hypothetical protein
MRTRASCKPLFECQSHSPTLSLPLPTGKPSVGN